jgi:uncharacterized protein DUF3788
LRYKKTKAFCTLLPAYRMFSVLVVLGRAEREKFEERRYFWSPQLVKLYDEARPNYPGKTWASEVRGEDATGSWAEPVDEAQAAVPSSAGGRSV